MKCTAKLVRQPDIGRLLATPTWTVHSLFDLAAAPKHPPSDAELLRLCQMAGLNPPSETMKRSLYNQLKFVETLRDCNTDGVEPLTRLVAPVVVPDPGTARPFEQDAPWDPVNLASESEAGCYVVKGAPESSH